VHKGPFAANLVLILLSTGCSTILEPPTRYKTAHVNAETQSDAVQELDPVDSIVYPMLYYESPGVRRLDHALY